MTFKTIVLYISTAIEFLDIGKFISVAEKQVDISQP